MSTVCMVKCVCVGVCQVCVCMRSDGINENLLIGVVGKKQGCLTISL
jgi:hypothetical protein